MKSKFSLLKLYLVLMSLTGIIGLLVAYGIAIQTVISQKLITDEEYIQGSYQNYTITSCEEPKPVGATTITKTDKEIATCKEEAKKQVILQRNYSNKNSIIGGLIRGTLALLAFATHFPFLIRKEKDIGEEEKKVSKAKKGK